MTATAAVAAGETAISVETGGTDLTLNQYADGYLWVNDVNGEGQMLRVKSNPAHDHSSDPSVVITCYDDLATALTTSSQLSLIEKSKY
jgi:ligand-binding sensor domain-containing protein